MLLFQHVLEQRNRETNNCTRLAAIPQQRQYNQLQYITTQAIKQYDDIVNSLQTKSLIEMGKNDDSKARRGSIAKKQAEVLKRKSTVDSSKAVLLGNENNEKVGTWRQLPPNYQPTDLDVCCGRGKVSWHHAGNVAFRSIMQDNCERYDGASGKIGKTLVITSIVAELQGKGYKFIKKNNAGNWYDIGDAEFREKVAHGLRDQVNLKSKEARAPGDKVASRKSISKKKTHPKRNAPERRSIHLDKTLEWISALSEEEESEPRETKKRKSLPVKVKEETESPAKKHSVTKRLSIHLEETLRWMKNKTSDSSK